MMPQFVLNCVSISRACAIGLFVTRNIAQVFYGTSNMTLRGNRVNVLAIVAIVEFHCAFLCAANPPTDPFTCLGSASQFARSASPGEVSTEVHNQTTSPPGNASNNPVWNCYIAELMKRVGDYRAPQFYRKAIDLAPDEAAYELFYAEYLRLFRGARSPLFGRAEKHYFLGLEKARQRGKSPSPFAWDPDVLEHLDRGLIDLYQRDGLGVAFWPSNRVNGNESLGRPFASLATALGYAFASDVPTGIDVRDLTSGAAYSAGTARNKRPLTNAELASMIRAVKPLEAQPRIRFRYKEMPSFDLFYNVQSAPNAQVTNFYLPDRFNGVKLYQFGTGFQEPFALGKAVDVTVSGLFERSRRVGVVEFEPSTAEVIHTYQGAINLARNLGPDKVLLDITWSHQGIEAKLSGLPRGRDFEGLTLTYQIYRPLRVLHRSLESSYTRVFETRGIDLYSGILKDRETFNDADRTRNVIDHRRDLFFGIAAKGLGRFDVTLQPTFYAFRTNLDPPENNSQYRTVASVLTRLRDEERHPGMPKNGGWALAFLHLVIPVTSDVPQKGLDKFANFKLGAELDAKWISTNRVTILGTARYDFQDFYKLRRELHLFKLGVSMGF